MAPPALTPVQQAELKAAVQRPPREAGIEQADWHWKVVRRFVSERFGITLARSSCHTYLHRLGFVVKRPQKRLLKADEAKRTAFVTTYAALRAEARASGAKHVFVDEAHFYADVDVHGKWSLTGTPALVDSTSPRYGEKASYSAAVCLETGEVDALPLTGHSSAQTSVAFLQHLAQQPHRLRDTAQDAGPAGEEIHRDQGIHVGARESLVRALEVDVGRGAPVVGDEISRRAHCRRLLHKAMNLAAPVTSRADGHAFLATGARGARPHQGP